MTPEQIILLGAQAQSMTQQLAESRFPCGLRTASQRDSECEIEVTVRKKPLDVNEPESIAGLTEGYAENLAELDDVD